MEMKRLTLSVCALCLVASVSGALGQITREALPPISPQGVQPPSLPLDGAQSFEPQQPFNRNGTFVDGVATPPPPQKLENQVAVFAGLDKITGRIIRFDVKIDETVQFGALQVTPRVCYSRPATETPQTTSFVKVDELTLDRKIQPLFSGWMFAASPGLHAVDHAVYDVWLADCKSADQFSLKPVTTSGDDLGGRGFDNNPQENSQTAPVNTPAPSPLPNPIRG